MTDQYWNRLLAKYTEMTQLGAAHPSAVFPDPSLGSLDCLHVHRHILEAGVGHAARNERLGLHDVLSELLVVETELSDAGQLGARGGC